jgi:hypothetical protein
VLSVFANRSLLLFAVLSLGLAGGCGNTTGGMSDVLVQDGNQPPDPGRADTLPGDTEDPDLPDAATDPGAFDADDPGLEDPGQPPPDTGPDATTDSFGVFQVRDLTDVGHVRAMWVAPGGTIWAVGDAGLVLRSDGGDFLPAPMPPAAVDLHGVSGAGAAVFVVGAGGTAWRLDASGWTDLAPPTEVDLMAVDAIAEDDVFVVGREGTILNLKGDAWHLQPTGITSDLYGVSASAVGGVHVVGAFGGLLQRQSTTWVRSQIAGAGVTLRAIWRAPDGRMVAVGSAGTVVLYDGLSWKQQLTTETASPPRTLFAVTGLDAEDIVAVGDAGAVVQYDAGKWRMATVAGPFNALADLRAVAAAASSDGSVRVVAGGLDSAAIARTEGGEWVDRVLGVTADLHGVDVQSDGTAVAVGEAGLVLTVREGRIGTRPSGTDADLNAVSRRYAVGDLGTLLDLGLDPVQRITTGTEADLTDVWADDEGAWIAAADGSLFRLDPDGVRLEVRRGISLTAVCASGSARWVGGVDGRLERNDADGDRLLPTDSGSTLRDLAPAGDRVIVVGDNGLALACGPSDCLRLFEDPATFLYGVHRQAERTVAAGWAGLVLVQDGDAPFIPLDTDTFRVFRDVSADADGTVWTFVGLDGTLATWTPGDKP